MKYLYWAGENLPLIIAALLSLIAVVTDDIEAARFYLIMGGFFIVMRTQAEIKALIKKERLNDRD